MLLRASEDQVSLAAICRSTATIEAACTDLVVDATARIAHPYFRWYLASMSVWHACALSTDAVGARGRVRGPLPLGVRFRLVWKKRTIYWRLSSEANFLRLTPLVRS